MRMYGVNEDMIRDRKGWGREWAKKRKIFVVLALDLMQHANTSISSIEKNFFFIISIQIYLILPLFGHIPYG